MEIKKQFDLRWFANFNLQCPQLVLQRWRLDT